MPHDPTPPIPNLSATIAQMQAIGRINQRQIAQIINAGRISQRQRAQLEAIGKIKLDAPIFRIAAPPAPIFPIADLLAPIFPIPKLDAPIFPIADLLAPIARIPAPIFPIADLTAPIARVVEASRIDLRPIIEQSQLRAPRLSHRADRAADPTDSEETQ